MRKTQLLAALVLSTMAVSPVVAEKPEWAGKGKGHSERDHPGKGKGKGHDRNDAREEGRRSGHFHDRHRTVVHDYYDDQYRRGHCPPGLAKKNNGCMPPGQAKKWRQGQPLPREVRYYDVPQPLISQLGAPPPGHQYVRVDSDILLIAAGSTMVVDAIQNLGRR